MPETAGTLRDGDGEQRLALAADVGALGDVAQAVEVDVGAGENRDQGLVAGLPARGVIFQAGNGERPRGLGDRARVLVDIQDRRTDLVGVHQDNIVDARGGNAIGLGPDDAHRDAVRKQTDVIETNRTAGLQRRVHGRRILRLDPDDLHGGPECFHIGRDTADQPTATHGYEDRVDSIAVLAQNLEADRALAGDHIDIVERVDKDQAFIVGDGVGALK